MKKVIKAPAKVNLCLKINGKREDGYHDLTTIMQKVSLFDTIELEILKENEIDALKFLKKLELSKKFDYRSEKQINLKCNYGYIPTDERNLIYKIVKYIYDRFGIRDRIFIYLKKMIPTSGGLGGGSSDAAAMLLFLNKYYKLKLDTEELNDIAANNGSDISFFIHKTVSLCKGRGEIVTELKPYNNYYILIATPNIRVSTKEIFSYVSLDKVSAEVEDRNIKKLYNALNAIEKNDIKMLSKNLFNDLELVTEPMYERVRQFKNRIVELGALTSLMSGSGPTVFGIFDSYIKALNCKKIMKKENIDSFIFISRPI